eukprot:gb/GECG01002322.1/.p1 GENE.gb/GECG01002322.1/~~gb/GECG01002322.1/.p1  ORF type:complete len:386 (+),score=49.91 gb/GECG01002322.1/:1-1158(+)
MAASQPHQLQHDDTVGRGGGGGGASSVVVEESSEGRFKMMEVKDPEIALGEEGDEGVAFRKPNQRSEFPLHSAPFLVSHQGDGPEDVRHKPVVFICGWASASDEELKKYANFYTMEFGVATIRASCTAIEMFLQPGGLEAFTLEGLRVLHEYFHERPVVFHVLSCGGFHIYNEIQKQWDEIDPVVPQTSEVLGIILDHCPHAYNTESVATAISERLPHWTVQYAVSWTVRSILSLFWNQTGEYSEHCQLRERKVPQLYFYSKEDRQISISELENHIRQRGSRGTASIQSIAFDCSEHLSGLRHFTKPYKMAIHNFIVLCLSFMDKSVEEFFMPTGATHTSIQSNIALGNEESATEVANFGQGVLLPQDNHIVVGSAAQDEAAAAV